MCVCVCVCVCVCARACVCVCVCKFTYLSNDWTSLVSTPFECFCDI